jgi:hypothetical protein
MSRHLAAMKDEEDWNGFVEASRYKYSTGAISPGED